MISAARWWRQVLERGDERELDRLALVVAGVGAAKLSASGRRSSG